MVADADRIVAVSDGLSTLWNGTVFRGKSLYLVVRASTRISPPRRPGALSGKSATVTALSGFSISAAGIP
jgi:hypothetical protein